MAVRDIFKVTRKTFFNPAAWMDYDALVAQNKTIWAIISGIIRRRPPGEPETFEQLVQRQGLTEKNIEDAAGTYRALAFVFLLLAVSSLSYAIFLVFNKGSLTGCILALAVMALFGAQMFKYDFWALQMRRRQLGLTFQDWKRQYLGD